MKLAVGTALLAAVLPALSAPASVSLPGISSPVAYGTKRVEQEYTNNSPDTFVKTSVVHLFVPLKGSVQRPPQCDYISFLRFRHADGPADWLKADRIQSFMPGTIAGAASAEQLARNVVFYAKQNHQQNVEFWSMDRRSNCLEDNTGVYQAVQQKNAQLSFDYYYNRKSVNGRTFQGWKGSFDPSTALLAELGVDQTSSDWYDVITSQIPDPSFRATKHYASGHSLGGPLTALFAAYDRDGNANTTADAGYNQAAGFLAYDATVGEQFGTIVYPDFIKRIIQPFLDLGFPASLAGFRSGFLARAALQALPIVLNTEVIQYIGMLGARAVLDPKGEANTASIPRTPSTVSATQFFLSKTYAQFLTLIPSAFNLRVTNEFLVASTASDRSQAFGFLQVSVGFGTGGSIAQRSFPVSAAPDNFPSNLTSIDGFVPVLSPYPLAVPDDAGFLGFGGGPLYKWLNYDEIAADGSNVAKAQNGRPFVTAANQVTDIAAYCRALAANPLDFSEQYFPTRLATDVAYLGYGSSTKVVAPQTLHRGSFAKRPTLNIVGSEGLTQSGAFGALGNHVTAPGYNHLDVLLAARKQNLGRKEISSISTADFISKLGAGVLA